MLAASKVGEVGLELFSKVCLERFLVVDRINGSTHTVTYYLVEPFLEGWILQISHHQLAVCAHHLYHRLLCRCIAVLVGCRFVIAEYSVTYGRIILDALGKLINLLAYEVAILPLYSAKKLVEPSFNLAELLHIILADACYSGARHRLYLSIYVL